MTTEQKASPSDAGQGAAVLLVDDDPRVLGVLERMLSRSHRWRPAIPLKKAWRASSKAASTSS